MRQVSGWLMVFLLCCSCATRRETARQAPPDPRLVEAQTDVDAAKRLKDTGGYSEALVRLEHARALREAVLGSTHPDVASCLSLEGEIYVRQRDQVHAEPLLQRALELQDAAFGNTHVDVAKTLKTLADLYADQHLYARAEPLYQRALAIREGVLGKNHPSVALSLISLSILYARQREFGRAEALLQRALSIQEAALGDKHPDVALTLYNLATLLVNQGLDVRAEPLLQRALAIREAALGDKHPDVAWVLVQLAGIYRRQGSYERAEPLLQRALAIQEVALGDKHPDVAHTLNNLAVLYSEQGSYGRAEPLFQRVLALREAALGDKHPDVAETLNNLAALYMEQGLYGRAEPLFQRTLTLMESVLGNTHPGLSLPLSNLAIVYAKQGLYGRAESLLQRALALQESPPRDGHLVAPEILQGLATLYMEQGLYDRAEPLLQRSLALQEAFLGKDHIDVAKSLQGLAGLALARGSYDQAESLLQRALALREAVQGKSHPLLAEELQALATLYTDQGLYERAEPLLRRALAIREAAFGDNHPDIARVLNDLARLYLAQHRLDSALPLYTRAFAMSERRLRQEALDFSESRLALFLQYLRSDEQDLYALLREHPENATVRHLALSAVLLLKGRSVEETANISRALYRGLGASDRATFEQLRDLRTQLAMRSLSGPGALSKEDYQRRLKQLADQGDSLEADLATRSASLRALTALPPATEIVERVGSSLAPRSALVEFIAYDDSPRLLRPGTPPAAPSGTLRYFALVLFPDASLRAVDLGPAGPIDRAASRLRNALAHHDASFQAVAQELYRLAFQPLRPVLGDTHRLLLSPDGQLGLVPFAALHDGKHFLLDSFDFTYLTSGRDLLPRATPGAPSSSVVVLADPDFTAAPAATPPSRVDTSAQAAPPASLERFFSTSREALPNSEWTPLPGTRREARSIQHLLPQAQLFLGAEATKQRLLTLPTPGILHLATHGFFLENTPVPSVGSRALGHSGVFGDDLQPLPPEPLLRSGLALAGAHTPGPDASTPSAASSQAALVTALEMSGLDLWGTQLVVLSACDTGRGDVHLGQGVYGLRRALVAAGAETVVTSLWTVKDDSTSLLMEAYYRNLVAGQGRASALREAMRELRTSHPHPHDWAPFIALGSDAPLRGITPAAPRTSGE